LAPGFCGSSEHDTLSRRRKANVKSKIPPEQDDFFFESPSRSH